MREKEEEDKEANYCSYKEIKDKQTLTYFNEKKIYKQRNNIYVPGG